MKRFTPAWLGGLSGMQFLHLFSGRGRSWKPARFRACRRDFIKGADISTLLDAEKHGATFYDQE
ncbi:hypothetical protein LNP26_04495 [Klebsiella variicola subsp. variicola]|nr:hypothetical protein [Klebsiella variicola subsp. variicola]